MFPLARKFSIPVLIVLLLLTAVSVLASPRFATLEDTVVYMPVAIGRPPGPVPPAGLDQIVYAISDVTSEINTIRADGSGKTKLTVASSGDYGPRWSPDRRLVAFVQLQPTSAVQLMVMNADGSGARAIPTPKLDMIGGITWSPDGATLAFEAYTKSVQWDIYRIGLDGSDLTNLTSDQDGNKSSPDWSPDGTSLVYARSSPRSGPFDLWVMNSDGGSKVNLTNDDAPQYDPRWSPDGLIILFGTVEGIADESIRSMPAGGGASKHVLDNAKTGDWSPDGTQIVFSGSDGGIFRANANGQSIVAVDEDPNARSPDW